MNLSFQHLTLIEQVNIRNLIYQGKVGIDELVFFIEKLKSELDSKQKLLSYKNGITVHQFEQLCQELVPGITNEDIYEMILDINQTEKDTMNMTEFVNKIYDL